ncbi:MAG: hypothetical protein NC548_53285 [Lachnospiraceae bacterium]|nr:hypothetical protein [Lachnospiraceae bacterium]
MKVEMYRVIIASKSYEDLQIPTFKLHTESAPSLFERCSSEQDQIVRQAYERAVIMNEVQGITTRIPMDSLVSSQTQNYVKNLKTMYEHADSITRLEHLGEELPTVVQYEGVNYLLDGNHRATLIKALGGDTLKCRFFEIS